MKGEVPALRVVRGNVLILSAQSQRAAREEEKQRAPT
jgi:hypothetical protein